MLFFHHHPCKYQNITIMVNNSVAIRLGMLILIQNVFVVSPVQSLHECFSLDQVHVSKFSKFSNCNVSTSIFIYCLQLQLFIIICAIVKSGQLIFFDSVFFGLMNLFESIFEGNVILDFLTDKLHVKIE